MMKKRLLLIAYNFPPIGGPRAIRWLNFIKHLSEDYLIDVLTIKPEKGYGEYDGSLLGDIPQKVTIYRTYPGPLHRFKYRQIKASFHKMVKGKYRNIKKCIDNFLKRFINMVLIPDKTIEWLPWGIIKLNYLLNKNRYNLVISSATPFTCHLMGYYAKKKKRVPWIADYGDPWTYNPFSPSPIRRQVIERRIERKLLKYMDKIVVTTDKTKELYIEKFKFLKSSDIAVIPTGYEDYEKLLPVTNINHKFRVVYTGIFYKNRSPWNFLEAVRKLKFKLEILMVGNISPEVRDYIMESGITEKVKIISHIAHHKAIEMQREADVLLLLGSGEWQIPSKLFEYIGACRPILCIRYRENDLAANLVKHYNRGIVVYNNADEIANALKKLFILWKQKRLNSYFSLDKIEKYSYTHLSDSLKTMIEELLEVNR